MAVENLFWGLLLKGIPKPFAKIFFEKVQVREKEIIELKLIP